MTEPTPTPRDATKAETKTAWPLLTVNILAYNRKDEVRQTLRELEGVDYPREQLEIIVVDNDSSDGTKEMVEAEFPHVRLLDIHPNRAVAGWNAGFEAGRGDYFLVLDDDSCPQSGLKEAITYLQQNPKVGILACQIMGGPFTTQDWENKEEFVGFIGCGALIRRDVVQAIGGYASWIHLYTHEWEYGLRCLDAGFEIRYFEGCVVRHRASQVNRSARRSRVYSTRNELLIVHRYFRTGRPLLLLRTVLHNARFCRTEGWRSLFYILRAVGMFWREAPHLEQSFVKPQVQRQYVALYWSLQPLLGSLFQQVSKRLKPLKG